MRWWYRSEGNGTVMGLLLVVLTLLALGCVLLFVAASGAATQAGTAADLAALAAADTARGLRPGTPCTVAEALSRANGAVLEECHIETPGDTVRITVSVPVNFAFSGISLYHASAASRAGPPDLF